MESAEAYRGMVERLEREANQSPGTYKLKVALLAGVGFLVLGGAVLLALGMSVGLVLVLFAISPILILKLAKIIWIPIGFGWLVLKALWVKFEPPEGHRLAPGEAPDLQAEIERLRIATGAPKLNGIIIDADLNAAAASIPRVLGLMGHSHYLVLGLPLMHLLNREQFAAVVAHEFGHFGGGHGRFTGWIYRVRVSWYKLLEALSVSGSWTSKLFTRFFNWYAPYFNAYSFALARGNEYQADAAAARVMGARVTGSALTRVHVGSERLQLDFWPSVDRATQMQAEPPTSLYRDMAASLQRTQEEDESRLGKVLALVGDLHDTHPTLSQRLAALGVEFENAPPPQRSAATDLLADLLPRLEEHFSDEWRQRVGSVWQERYDQHTEGVSRLAELEKIEVRSPDQVVEHARLVEDLNPETDALPFLLNAVHVAPEHPVARFRLGSLMLDRGDAGGALHLRKAMEIDSDFIEISAQRLGQHYHEIGDQEGLSAMAQELDALYESRARSARARNELRTDDVFELHGMEPEVVRAAHETLERFGRISKAWIVRKRISDDPNGYPHYVVLVAWRGMVLSENSTLQKLVEALELPGSFMAFTAPKQRGIAKRVKQAAGSPLYHKGRP